MYDAFYNLRAEPFRLSPEHRFCYVHKGYAKARAYMAYAFMRAEGFVMVTGRPGTGKTTLIGDLIESLAGDDVTTANLVCTQLQGDDLLKTVAYSFGVGDAQLEKADLLQRLNVIFHKWHRDGRRALLIVDEAQDLSLSAMEELRLLTNIQVDGQPLLQIFLLGQPELRDLILSPQLEQVHQRIVAASHLDSLEQDETEEYVRHRLDAVGWRGDPAISKSIFPLVHKFSEGVPRRINLICSRLLLHGSVEQRHSIGVQDIRTVIMELQGENLAAGTKFSEDDFALEDEFEQINHEVEPQSVEAAAEVHSQAVVDDPVSTPNAEIAPLEPAPRQKPSPLVSEESRLDTADSGVAGGDSNAFAGYSVEGSKSPQPDSTLGVEVASQVLSPVDVGQSESVISPPLKRQLGAAGGSISSRGRVAQKKPGRKAISPHALILLISVGTIVGYLAFNESLWGEWQGKWLEVWSNLRE